MDITNTVTLQLDRMEMVLNRIANRDQSPVVGVSEAMEMVGAKTVRTLHRTLQRLHVNSCTRGKYRRTDILNAMGRETLLKQKQSRLHAESEAVAESRRKPSRLSPHDD